MPKILNRFIKWSLRIIVVVLIVLALQISVLAFPQPFFSHKMETDYGTVYSDREFSRELSAAVNEVSDRLKVIELYDDEKDDCVFICHSQKLYNFFARLSMVTTMAQGYNLSIFHNSFISLPRVNQLRSSSGGFPPYAITEGTPAHTIAHELMHQYMADETGYFGYRKINPMKLEGLAEYGASIAAIRQDTVNTLPRRIGFLLDDNNWYPGYDRVREHYRAALTVEYLVEIEGRCFAAVLSDPMNLKEAYEEMLEWHRKI